MKAFIDCKLDPTPLGEVASLLLLVIIPLELAFLDYISEFFPPSVGAL